jgi:MoxR-like ATPase
MDRFALQFELGYIAPDEEVNILTDQVHNHPLHNITPVASTADILRLRQAVTSVRISDELKRYIVDIVSATRGVSGVQLGASPRASLAVMKTAQAVALFDGGEFVPPDHIHEVATSVVAHRLVIDPQAKFSGQTARAVVQEILKRIPVPA